MTVSGKKRYQFEQFSGYSSRSMIKAAELNKLVMIDGITAGAWISRMERMGRPLKVYKPVDGVKRYRVGEIVTRVLAADVKVSDPTRPAPSPSAFDVMPNPPGSNARHILECGTISKVLTGRSLWSARVIVPKAKSSTEKSLCGVYFLVSGDEVVYIGQSKNIYSRVGTHQADPGKNFDSWCYVQCESHSLDVLESLYIHFLQPRLNGRIGQSDQISAPMSIDEMLSKIKIKGAA